MTSHPAASLRERVDHKRAYERVKKKTYIRAEQFPAPLFDKNANSLRADPDWKVVSAHGCGHDIMLDTPDQLSKWLLMSA